MTTKTSIITSPLDLDFYKLTMGRFVWERFPETRVVYALTNRHARRVPIAELVDEDELREELEAIRELPFTDEEIEYLRESVYIPRGMFPEEYLAFLSTMRLPEVSVERRGDQYDIRVEGLWKEAVYWETKILSPLNELVTGAYAHRAGLEQRDLFYEGARRLHEKIHAFGRVNPIGSIVEFGTRRRASRAWHEELTKLLLSWMPHALAGTSNVDLARTTGLRPIGTFAHEMTMAYAALAAEEGPEAIHASHLSFFDDWFAMYGRGSSIALTDTWGAASFFEDFGEERARLWRGLRHDSGDPFVWAERALSFYRSHGVDPRQKILLFSDGLKAETILALWRRFGDASRLSFGWGTNLTNDVGFPATSLVVKLAEVNGVRTVKLSDNLAKAMGPRAEIERYARIFEHESLRFEPCTY